MKAKDESAKEKCIEAYKNEIRKVERYIYQSEKIATKIIPSLRNLSYEERLTQGWYNWSVEDDLRYWQGKSREAFFV